MSFFKSITWKYISKFGENKIINRSYIYLIIVPIIAKLLSKIQSPISIFLGGEKVELVVELPFNWKLFFFSALIFSVASGLYSIFVPKIISENKSYGSFLNEGKTFIQIVGFMDNLKITDEWIKEQKLEISEVKANGGYNYAKRIIQKGTQIFKSPNWSN